MFDDLDSDSLSQINFGTPLYSNGPLGRYRWGRKMNMWDGQELPWLKSKSSTVTSPFPNLSIPLQLGPSHFVLPRKKYLVLRGKYF